jgi:hypothetical protein
LLALASRDSDRCRGSSEHTLVFLIARKIMNQRCRVASALLLTMLSVAGCSNQPAGYSRAYGKLSYKGAPAAGAVLVFQLEGQSQSADVVVPAATVAEDGSFVLASPNGDGAPPGKYKVLVSWPADSPADGAATQPKSKDKAKSGPARRKNKQDTLTKDRLHGRFSNVDTPLTVVEVKAETTDLGSLEIKD